MHTMLTLQRALRFRTVCIQDLTFESIAEIIQCFDGQVASDKLTAVIAINLLRVRIRAGRLRVRGGRGAWRRTCRAGDDSGG
jgi:hypothetical protein